MMRVANSSMPRISTIAATEPEAFYAYYPAVRRLVDLLRHESGS